MFTINLLFVQITLLRIRSPVMSLQYTAETLGCSSLTRSWESCRRICSAQKILHFPFLVLARKVPVLAWERVWVLLESCLHLEENSHLFLITSSATYCNGFAVLLRILRELLILIFSVTLFVILCVD